MRVRCNDCMSIFDENYIDVNVISGDEFCPICNSPHLMDMEEETENYKKFRDVLTHHIGVTTLVNFDDENNDELVGAVHDIVRELLTDKKCPHCDALLYLSDLPDYEYVCIECEENFYEIEVK